MCHKPLFPNAGEKVLIFYYPYPVFHNVILTWGIKPGRHLLKRFFVRNYTYILSLWQTYKFIK